MNVEEAKKKIEIIEKLVHEIYVDKELQTLDPRYQVAAKWCDMDIDCVSLE